MAASGVGSDELRELLAANQMIISDLELPVVLRRIVRAACQLVHARYGALGVLAPDGGLAEFVHVGMDEQTVAGIGPVPAGKGLLGALIDDPRPIRLRRIGADPRSVGFPAAHPPMDSFLGVPIRIRGEVFGNLYLTEAEAGEFTAEDEELMTALAATAAVAIQNARLYARAQLRQTWLQASARITRQLLAMEGEEPLSLIAREARELADADLVTVVLPTPDGQRLMVEVASGRKADELTGYSYPVENTYAGQTFKTGEPILLADAGDDGSHYVHLTEVLSVGPVMVVPLVGTQRMRGALVVGRVQGRRRFEDADLDMATTFANHATVALELADARADQQRVLLLEERDRIARDLHDHVIQQLFATGLSVQSVAATLGGDARSQRLERVVSGIDDTIRQIRTTIFQLRGSLGPQTGTVRARLLEVIAELARVLGSDPRVEFDGPVDSVVPESVLDDLVAVTREALTNVARHAEAEQVSVRLSATSARLELEVRDDGVGVDASHRRSGLANLQRRAEHLGGSLQVEPVAPGGVGTEPNTRPGTRLTWTIPLR
jgi:signal transduction histidine kinase